MSKKSRFAVLAVVSSVAAALVGVPGAAFAADPATKLTAAEMAAALKGVATTSTAAGKDGWKGTETLGGFLSGSAVFLVDPADGILYTRFRLDGALVGESYLADHQGFYDYLTEPGPRAAVKAMNRPSARYVFTPDKAVSVPEIVKEDGAAPASVLTEDTKHAGTKTVHDDGSSEYGFTNDDGAAVTIAVTPDGVLSDAHLEQFGLTIDLAYAYGPQHPVLPAGEVTVSSADLDMAMDYRNLAADVRAAATKGAAAARKAAHGRTTKVAAVRKSVRKAAARTNAAILRVTDIAGGVQVSATNPWTHQTVAYTVKASGKRVVVGQK
jgi:hypothetical protein